MDTCHTAVAHYNLITDVAIIKQKKEMPTQFLIKQNYPNPFNPDTHIEYQLPEPSMVILIIFNLLGQEVCTLVQDNKQAGYFIVYWDGRENNGLDVPSGIYICRMQAGNFIAIKKLLLLR